MRPTKDKNHSWRPEFSERQAAVTRTSVPRELLACELKAFALRLEARPEYRRIERILCRIIIFDVHIEFAEVRREKGHDRSVIRKLSSREHDLIRTFLIKLLKPCVSFVWFHGGLAYCLRQLAASR